MPKGSTEAKTVGVDQEVLTTLVYASAWAVDYAKREAGRLRRERGLESARNLERCLRAWRRASIVGRRTSAAAEARAPGAKRLSRWSAPGIIECIKTRT